MPLLLVEQLRAPSWQSAVAFPKLLLMHAAGWMMSSSLQILVLPESVRVGNPGSPTGDDVVVPPPPVVEAASAMSTRVLAEIVTVFDADVKPLIDAFTVAEPVVTLLIE